MTDTRSDRSHLRVNLNSHDRRKYLKVSIIDTNLSLKLFPMHSRKNLIQFQNPIIKSLIFEHLNQLSSTILVVNDANLI